jgi:hypothetical protein
VNALLLRLEAVSQRVMPTLMGPRPLLDWHAEALPPVQPSKEAKTEP